MPRLPSSGRPLWNGPHGSIARRAYRYIYLDAGHIAQNLYLAAEALDMGACTIGAFFDDDVNGLMGFDGTEETVIYMATAGLRPVEPNASTQ